MKVQPAKYEIEGVVVEAFIWDGQDPYGVMAYVNERWSQARDTHASVHNDRLRLDWEDEDGKRIVHAAIGDWIIDSEDGFWPCTHDQFMRHYQPVFPGANDEVNQ